MASGRNERDVTRADHSSQARPVEPLESRQLLSAHFPGFAPLPRNIEARATVGVYLRPTGFSRAQMDRDGSDRHASPETRHFDVQVPLHFGGDARRSELAGHESEPDRDIAPDVGAGRNHARDGDGFLIEYTRGYESGQIQSGYNETWGVVAPAGGDGSVKSTAPKAQKGHSEGAEWTGKVALGKPAGPMAEVVIVRADVPRGGEGTAYEDRGDASKAAPPRQQPARVRQQRMGAVDRDDASRQQAAGSTDGTGQPSVAPATAVKGSRGFTGAAAALFAEGPVVRAAQAMAQAAASAGGKAWDGVGTTVAGSSALAGAAARVGGVIVDATFTAAADVADLAGLASSGQELVAAAGTALSDSGLIYLPAGPAMLLGLAPPATGVAKWTWWPSQQVWRVTEAVSLVVAIAGFGYCRADAERRRLRPVATSRNVFCGTRPADGL